MNSCAPAARAAALTSSGVAVAQPYAMLAITVSENRKLSSNTTPMWPRSESSRRWRTSMPSTWMDPACTS